MKLLKLSKMVIIATGIVLAYTPVIASNLEPYMFVGPESIEVSAYRGSFTVPENRNNPNSRHIEIQYVKFPALTDSPGNPIVYLSGGPGGSATGTAKGPRFELFMKMRKQADVILFDQRGTGLSDSLEDCKLGSVLAMDKALTPEGLVEYLVPKIEQCQNFWKEKGYDLKGYNTRESATDLVDLARELGSDKLDLWGISYGTHLALTTAKYHPEIINKMILASTEGLEQTIKLPRYSDALLQRIDDLVKADDKASIKYPDWRESLETLLQKLDDSPVIVNTKKPYDGKTFQLKIGKFDIQLLLSYIMLKNPDTIAQLPALVEAMHSGRFESVAPMVAGIRYYFHSLNPMALAMDAASGIEEDRWQRVKSQSETAVLWRAANFPFPDINAAIGVSDLGAEFRTPLWTDIPTLFFAGTLDGRTYIEEQKMVARGFSNKVFITLQGAGHDLFMSSPVVGDMMLEFLDGKKINSQYFNIGAPKFL